MRKRQKGALNMKVDKTGCEIIGVVEEYEAIKGLKLDDYNQLDDYHQGYVDAIADFKQYLIERVEE